MQLLSLSDFVFPMVAFLCAIAVIMSFALVLDRSAALGGYYIPSFSIVIIIAIAAKTILLQRNLNYYSSDTTSILGLESAGSDWLLRFGSLYIIGISIVVIFDSFLGGRNCLVEKEKKIYCGFLIFYIGCNILNAVMGTVPALSYKTIYPLIVFVAIYRCRNFNVYLFVDVLKYSAIFSIFVGFIFLLIKPSLVLQKNYHGIISSLNYRYWGVDSHPNGLGPLAAVAVLLLIWRPINSKMANIVALIFVLTALILSQSKTSILALAFAVGVWFLYKIVLDAAWKKSFNISIEKLVFLMIMLIGVAIIILMFINFSASDQVARQIDGKAISSAAEFTGRERIWEISLNEFYRNPYFGYGNNIWDASFSNSYGLLGVASNSHNQLVDALASSGGVGFICIMIYLCLQIYVSWNIRVDTNGFSLAIAAFMMGRCFPEVPFKLSNMMSNDFIIHALYFSILVWGASAGKKVKNF